MRIQLLSTPLVIAAFATLVYGTPITATFTCQGSLNGSSRMQFSGINLQGDIGGDFGCPNSFSPGLIHFGAGTGWASGYIVIDGIRHDGVGDFTFGGIQSYSISMNLQPDSSVTGWISFRRSISNPPPLITESAYFANVFGTYTQTSIQQGVLINLVLDDGVPEPASAGLTGLGILLIVFFRNKISRAKRLG